jgi:hypothetical protein
MVWGASSLCRWSVFRRGGCFGDANTGCRTWFPLSRGVPFAGHTCSLGFFFALCLKFARLERLQFIHSFIKRINTKERTEDASRTYPRCINASNTSRRQPKRHTHTTHPGPLWVSPQQKNNESTWWPYSARLRCWCGSSMRLPAWMCAGFGYVPLWSDVCELVKPTHTHTHTHTHIDTHTHTR